MRLTVHEYNQRRDRLYKRFTHYGETKFVRPDNNTKDGSKWLRLEASLPAYGPPFSSIIAIEEKYKVSENNKLELTKYSYNYFKIVSGKRNLVLGYHWHIFRGQMTTHIHHYPTKVRAHFESPFMDIDKSLDFLLKADASQGAYFGPVKPFVLIKN